MLFHHNIYDARTLNKEYDEHEEREKKNWKDDSVF